MEKKTGYVGRNFDPNYYTSGRAANRNTGLVRIGENVRGKGGNGGVVAKVEEKVIEKVEEKIVKEVAKDIKKCEGKPFEKKGRKEKKMERNLKRKEQRKKFEKRNQEIAVVMPDYGHKNIYLKSAVGTDDTVMFEGDLDFNVVAHLAVTFVSAGLAAGGEVIQNSFFDHGYIARFLYDYICREALQIYQPYRLEEAPAVLWDVIHAVKPKRRGKYTYQCNLDTATPEFLQVTGTQFGGTLGIVSGAQDDYKVIDTTFTSYDGETGHEMTVRFFNEIGDKMDIVPDTYSKITAEDTSAYVSVRTQTDSKFGEYYFEANNVQALCERIIVTMQKPKNEWLARLGLINCADESYGKFMLRTYSAPGSLIAHRMLRRLRGYEFHDDHVIVKGIPLSEMILAVEQLMKKSIDAKGANPFTAEVSFSMLKYLFLICAIRHTSIWGAVTTGMYAGTDNPFFWNQTGSCLPKLAMSIRMPQVVEKNFAAFYPYRNGNIHFYPQIVMKETTAAIPAQWRPDGTSALTTNYNWATKIPAGALVNCAMVANINTIEIVTGWHDAMVLVESTVPISSDLKIYNFCLSQVTTLRSSGSVISQICAAEMSDPVKKEIDQMFTPEINMASATVISGYENILMETCRITEAMSLTVQPAYVNWIPGVHILAGQGDASADIAVQEVTSKRDEEKIDSENRNNNSALKDIVNGMKGVITKENVGLVLELVGALA